MTDEQVYRAAVRNDRKGTITYYRGALPTLLKLLQKSHDGIMEIMPDEMVFLVPATHHLPWEIPDELKTDSNLLTEGDEQ